MCAMVGATLSDRAAASSEGIKADAMAVSGLNMNAARFSPGAISESSSSHLPPSVGSKAAKPVVFPPGGSFGLTARTASAPTLKPSE